MRTRVSTKYQVVIPKEARKQEDIKPGQEMEVRVTNHRIVLSKAKSKNWEWPGDYLKNLPNPWEGMDPEEYLENERNSWK